MRETSEGAWGSLPPATPALIGVDQDALDAVARRIGLMPVPDA